MMYINKAVEKAGYTPGVDFMYAMDPASTEFYNTQTGMYELKGEGSELTSAQMVDYCCELVEKYPIISIEDGIAEDNQLIRIEDELFGSARYAGRNAFYTLR